MSPHSHGTTEHLLEDGGEDAWNQLIQRIQVYMQRRFRGMVPDRLRGVLDTEALVGDGLAKAATSKSRFRPAGPGSARAYLAKVIRNQLLDALRSSEAEKRDPPGELVHDPDEHQLLDDALDPAQVLAQVDEVLALLPAVQHLPAHLRMIVERNYLEQESLASIEKSTGVGESTLRRWRVEALLRLQRHLAAGERR
ncbi:MAG: sigma-70 family RNA polymerase sigma factor [Planctomycetota bacterium]